MTRQDSIGIREITLLRSMAFNPENSALVCERHNQSLFAGVLKQKKVTRGAGCYYCKREAPA